MRRDRRRRGHRDLGRLDLKSGADVERAFGAIMAGAKRYNPEARIEGVTIQFFIRPPDFELLVGFKRNDNFGPVLLFGLGGIFTEVLRDRNLPCRLSTA